MIQLPDYEYDRPLCWMEDQLVEDEAYDFRIVDDPPVPGYRPTCLELSLASSPLRWRVMLPGQHIEWYHEVLWAPRGFELPEDPEEGVPVLTSPVAMYRTVVFDAEWFRGLEVEHTGECLTCDHCMAIAAGVAEEGS